MRLRVLIGRFRFGEDTGLIVNIVVALRRSVDAIGPVKARVEPLRRVRCRALCRVAGARAAHAAAAQAVNLLNRLSKTHGEVVLEVLVATHADSAHSQGNGGGGASLNSDHVSFLGVLQNWIRLREAPMGEYAITRAGLRLLQSVFNAVQRRAGRVNLKEQFQAFDTDGDAQISRLEFAQRLKGLGLGLRDDALMSLTARFDLDGDGEIDYVEFVRYAMQQAPAERKNWMNALAMALENDTTELETLMDKHMEKDSYFGPGYMKANAKKWGVDHPDA